MYHAPKAGNAQGIVDNNQFPPSEYPGGVYAFNDNPQAAAGYANTGPYQGGLIELQMSQGEYDRLTEAGAISPDPDPHERSRGAEVIDTNALNESLANGDTQMTHHDQHSEDSYNQFGLR